MQLGRHRKEWLHVGALSKTFGCYPDPSQAISWFTLGLWGVEAYYEGILEEQLHSYFLGQGKPWSKLQVGGSSHSVRNRDFFFGHCNAIVTLGSYIKLLLGSNHPSSAVTDAGAVVFRASRSRCGQNGQTGV